MAVFYREPSRHNPGSNPGLFPARQNNQRPERHLGRARGPVHHRATLQVDLRQARVPVRQVHDGAVRQLRRGLPAAAEQRRLQEEVELVGGVAGRGDGPPHVRRRRDAVLQLQQLVAAGAVQRDVQRVFSGEVAQRQADAAEGLRSAPGRCELHFFVFNIFSVLE